MFQGWFFFFNFVPPEGGKGSVLLLHVLLPVSGLQLHTSVQQKSTLHLVDRLILISLCRPQEGAFDQMDQTKVFKGCLRVPMSVCTREACVPPGGQGCACHGEGRVGIRRCGRPPSPPSRGTPRTPRRQTAHSPPEKQDCHPNAPPHLHFPKRMISSACFNVEWWLEGFKGI